jgi:hypothetical protein
MSQHKYSVGQKIKRTDTSSHWIYLIIEVTDKNKYKVIPYPDPDVIDEVDESYIEIIKGGKHKSRKSMKKSNKRKNKSRRYRK